MPDLENEGERVEGLGARELLGAALNSPEDTAAHDADAVEEASVRARLEERGLRTAAAANRRTLIRRASLKLIGLPPPWDDVRSFVNDPRPTPVAFAAVVDRLLASPHYGERWGRHWLDVARYADNKGYVFFEEK